MSAGRTKATNEQLIESYVRTGSIWKTAEEFGMCGQSVHERLTKLGVVEHARKITDKDVKRLFRDYVVYRDAGKLEDLASDIGVTKTSLCRAAGKLGLTDRNHRRDDMAVWKSLPESVARPIFEDMKKSRKNVKEFCVSRGYGLSGFTRRMKELFPGEWDSEIERRLTKNSKYRAGRSFEYRVKRDMEAAGFNVIRSYASKGPADLTATNGGRIVYVQCKLHGTMGVTEWNRFMDYCDKGGGMPVLARRADDGNGIAYFELLDRKDGSKRPQPMEEIYIEEMGERNA